MSVPPDVPPPGGWPAPPGWPQPNPGWEWPTQPTPSLAPSPAPETASQPPAGGPGVNLPPGWRPTKPDVKPGVMPFRPLGVDDLLTATFATVRRNWQALLSISAAVAAVTAAFAVPLLLAAEPLVRELIAFSTIDPNASSNQFDTALRALSDAFLSFLPWLVLAFYVQMFAYAVIDAGAAIVVSRAVLGKPATAATVIRELARLLPKLLLLGVILATTISVGLLLCIVPGLLLSCLWFAAPASLVMERGSVLDALRRSSFLASKSFWRVVGLILLISVVYGIALQLVTTPVSFITSFGAFTASAGQSLTQGSVNAILLGYLCAILAALLGYPIVSVARALEYLDLRMRHEELAQTLSAAAQPPAAKQ